MSDPVRFNHIGQVVLDLERSRRFYEEVFGFETVRHMRVPDRPTDRLLGLSAPLGMQAMYLRKDGFVLELMSFDRPDNPPFARRVMNEPGLTHLSLAVDDVAAATDRVRRCGGQVLEETGVGVAVFVRDPDGQLIELLDQAYRPLSD